jgi:hypothetical protein
MQNKHTIECLREIPTTRIMVLIGLVVCFTCGLVGRCNSQQASKSQEENYNSRPTLHQPQVVTQKEAGYTAEEVEELYNSNTPR